MADRDREDDAGRRRKVGFKGWLSGLQAAYWDAFCSYAHGGLRLIARRNSAEAIEDVATEDEAIQVLRFAVLMSLMAGSVWCDLASDAEGATEASARAKPYLTKGSVEAGVSAG